MHYCSPIGDPWDDIIFLSLSRFFGLFNFESPFSESSHLCRFIFILGLRLEAWWQFALFKIGAAEGVRASQQQQPQPQPQPQPKEWRRKSWHRWRNNETIICNGWPLTGQNLEIVVKNSSQKEEEDTTNPQLRLMAEQLHETWKKEIQILIKKENSATLNNNNDNNNTKRCPAEKYLNVSSNLRPKRDCCLLYLQSHKSHVQFFFSLCLHSCSSFKNEITDAWN